MRRLLLIYLMAILIIASCDDSPSETPVACYEGFREQGCTGDQACPQGSRKIEPLSSGEATILSCSTQDAAKLFPGASPDMAYQRFFDIAGSVCDGSYPGSTPPPNGWMYLTLTDQMHEDGYRKIIWMDGPTKDIRPGDYTGDGQNDVLCICQGKEVPMCVACTACPQEAPTPPPSSLATPPAQPAPETTQQPAMPTQRSALEAAPADGFRIAAVGDTQFASDIFCTSGVEERKIIPGIMASTDPRLIIHTGDLMDHGYENGAYDFFKSCFTDKAWGIPFFPTSGNHDQGAPEGVKLGIYSYRDFLMRQLASNGASFNAMTFEADPEAAPNKMNFGTQYAFRHMNTYFISFEQGNKYWTNTPVAWVEEQLRAARADPSIRYIIVFMHNPVYSVSMPDDRADKEDLLPVRRLYEGLFRQYDVTLVLSGHVHTYERYYVPDDGSGTRTQPGRDVVSMDTDALSSQGAVTYIVTGGGGGPAKECGTLYKEGEPSHSYIRKYIDCGPYHFVVLDVAGDRIVGTAIKVGPDGSTSIIDSFEIR